MKRWPLLLLVGLLVPWPGCSTGGSAGGGATGITELHLFSYPMVLGGTASSASKILVKVFASKGYDTKGVPIRTGQLEVLMFDGFVANVDPNRLAPRKVWTFTAAELKSLETSKALGIGYDLALPLQQGEALPAKVTLLARYRAPRALPVYSEPTVVSKGAP